MLFMKINESQCHVFSPITIHEIHETDHILLNIAIFLIKTLSLLYVASSACSCCCQQTPSAAAVLCDGHWPGWGMRGSLALINILPALWHLFPHRQRIVCCLWNRENILLSSDYSVSWAEAVSICDNKNTSSRIWVGSENCVVKA